MTGCSSRRRTMSENPTDPKTRLIENLKELHLPAMRGGFEEVARIAQQESQSYERYLLELTERECQARRGNRIERSLRDSRLPLEKTLESLELKRLPVKVVQQVRALMDGTFADRRENVLAFGNPGSGKTHVLSAISRVDSIGASSLLPQLRADGAGPSGGQAGPEAERVVQEAV